MGSSPNYNQEPSNSFEWRKTIFGMVTSMGTRHAKPYNLRGGTSTKLEQSSVLIPSIETMEESITKDVDETNEMRTNVESNSEFQDAPGDAVLIKDIHLQSGHINTGLKLNLKGYMKRITGLAQSLNMAYKGKFDLVGSWRSSESLSSNAAK
ncbi:hypothetical protein Tco_1215625 [Tanacetum coccineum]